MPERRYDDPCGIARGLSLVGERWALLVVRELLLGPKRFIDLRRGLPTASQAVLTQRLRELERDGVVHRRRLAPPSGAMVYELTPWGRELEPVLEHLGRWGVQASVDTTADIGVDSLMLVVKSMFDPVTATDLRVRCEVRIGVDTFHADIADGRLDLARGDANRPDVVIETDPATAGEAVFGTTERRAELVAAGALRIDGDHRTLTRLIKAFTDIVPAH